MNNKQEAFLTAVNGPVVSTEGFVQTLKDSLVFFRLMKSDREKKAKEAPTTAPTNRNEWTRAEYAKVSAMEKALQNVTEIRKLPLKSGLVEGRFVSAQLYGEKTTFSVVHQRLSQTLKAVKAMQSSYPANLKSFQETLLKLAELKETWDKGEVNLRKRIHQELLKCVGRTAPVSLDPMILPSMPAAFSVHYSSESQLWGYGEIDVEAVPQIPALTTAEIIAAGKLIREINSLCQVNRDLADPCPDGTLWGYTEGSAEHDKVGALIEFIHEQMDEDGHVHQLVIPRTAFKYGWAETAISLGSYLELVEEALLVWIFESVDVGQYEIATEARISLESWFGFGGKDGPDSATKRLLGLLKDNDVKHTPVGDQALANLSEKLGYPLSAGVSDLYRYVGSFRSESGESPLEVHDPKQVIEATEKLLKITKQFKDPVVFASTYGGSYIYIAAGKYIIESYIDEEDGELNIQGRHSETPAKFLTGEPADKQWR